MLNTIKLHIPPCTFHMHITLLPIAQTFTFYYFKAYAIGITGYLYIEIN